MMKQPYYDLRPLGLRFELANYSGQLLGWGCFEPKPWRNFLHIHSYYELCFVTSGTGLFRVNGRDYFPLTGDLFLARPGDLHEIIASDNDPMGIIFYGFSLLAGRNDHPDKATSTLLDRFSRSTLDRPVVDCPAVGPLLWAFTEEVDQFRTGSRYALTGMMPKIVLDTVRAFAGETDRDNRDGLNGFSGGIVDEICRFLQDNLQRPLRVRDVATQFHLSERHINRLFKAERGETLMTYLKQIRLERAKTLLLLSDAPVGEIAGEVGIDDSRYFATLFRQATGVTPTTFRKRRGTIFQEEL